MAATDDVSRALAERLVALGCGPRERAYLELVARRLTVLATPACLAETTAAEAALARRTLRRHEGEWHDGDENLLRGLLGDWSQAGAEDLAERWLHVARQLASIEAGPATLWCFLWHFESGWQALAARGPSPAAPTLVDCDSTSRVTPRSGGQPMAKRILAVDDDENILNLERTILEQKGFHVTGAAGGQEALALLASQPFDLVLLDVMMPEVDGFMVCRRIKEDPKLKDMPVIFLTAKGGGDALAEGFESGAVMYINKPFTANKLLTIVNTMLESGSNL